MDRGMHKVVMIKRRTRLEDLKRRYNTIEQARFYVEHLGADFGDYVLEHENYYRALEEVRTTAGQYARLQEIDREYIPNMIFSPDDIVVAVGQDGLVANVMKYLDGQPLVGVNPDTDRWDGLLLPFEPGDMKRILPRVIEGKCTAKTITMGKAQTRDGQVMYAVNDFFIGINNHTSARYDICYNGFVESQSSSGIIVSTGLGMTGWHRSVMAQLKGMAREFGLGTVQEPDRSWDSDELIFQVREPYPGKATQADIVYGTVNEEKRLSLVSGMAEGGVIFSDGIIDDMIDFNAGMELKVSVAERRGRLIVD